MLDIHITLFIQLDTPALLKKPYMLHGVNFFGVIECKIDRIKLSNGTILAVNNDNITKKVDKTSSWIPISGRQTSQQTRTHSTYDVDASVRCDWTSELYDARECLLPDIPQRLQLRGPYAKWRQSALRRAHNIFYCMPYVEHLQNNSGAIWYTGAVDPILVSAVGKWSEV